MKLTHTAWLVFGALGVAIVTAGVLLWRTHFDPLFAFATLAFAAALATLAVTFDRKRSREEHAARIAEFEQLRHADRLATAGRLSEGIAHELGSPLTVVSGRAKMIANQPDVREPVREHARIIADQAVRMTKLVRQLLDFSRDQPGPRVTTDLRALTEESLKMLAPLAEKKGVHVELEVSQEAGRATVIEHQVGQALTNLLVNGLQAAKQGGHLLVGVRRERAHPPTDAAAPSDFVCLSVQDDGPGIAPADLPHIFDPFFTTRPFGEGTGLGLTVAYGIARDHGGWIDVESQPGTGSRFSLHLPISAG